MKKIDFYRMRRSLAALAAGLALGIVGTASGQDMYRMTMNSGGGVPAQAYLTLTNSTSTNATLGWYGTMGWYGVQVSTDLVSWTTVTNVEATYYAWQATVANTNPASYFRLNQANSYAGSAACSGCHGKQYNAYVNTVHGNAYGALVAAGSQNNARCLLCHTVGFNQPTGFTTNPLTAYLENVGCENCHGPAAWHKNADHAAILPVVSLAPEICGSCHQGHNPQYTEYTNSPHYLVLPDIAYGVSGGVYYTNTVVIGTNTYYGYYVTTNADLTLKTNATSGIISSSHVPGSSVDPGDDRQTSCGVCHSAAARMAMLTDYNARLNGYTNALALPTANDAGAWGAACVTCHDPHALRPSPVFAYKVTYVTNGSSIVTNTSMALVASNYVQMRNPLWSSNYYTMASLSDKRTDSFGNPYYMNTTFSSLYDPNVNICGQCHNTRGARWDGRSYGLISSTNAVTNLVISAAYTYTYTTNYNTYGQIVGVVTNPVPTGGTVTNTVVANVVTKVTGLTTTVSFSRSPHFSPQYNILIGILQPDYLNTTNGKTVYTNSVLTNGIGIYATHGGIAARNGAYNTNQCATCHVPSYTAAAGNVTGHTFDLDPNGCALGGCHTSGWPDYEGYQVQITNNIASVVDLLNRWATNNAPAILTNYNKYLLNSWEYTAPGVLASLTNAGPSAADQLKLPTAIQQARFNVYMARNDGSLGVHNPTFIPLLLKDAETKVLNQFTTAKFTANSITIGVGGTVTFTNLNAGVTSAVWDFGDTTGTNTTATIVAHQYTTAGTYYVALTASDVNGTETLTRNNYVNVYAYPTPAMTYGYTNSSLTHPITINFTNASVNAEYGQWSFYNTNNSYATSNRLYATAGMTAVFTYTNAGSYKVVLKASSPGGSASVTNTITVQ